MKKRSSRLAHLALSTLVVPLAVGCVAPANAENSPPVERDDPVVAVDSPRSIATRAGFNLAQAGDIPEVVDRVLPSVVSISSKRTIHGAELGQNPFEQFFGRGQRGRRHPPMDREAAGLGSGVIVSKDGVILTNNHVVEQADELRVTLSDGRNFEAKLVGADPASDLAVIKLLEGPQDLRPMTFGSSVDLRLGELVLAIGNPFGVGQTVTMGIVSAKGRANMGIVDYEDFIQTDAAINPGNSGGALVNLRGELVGINTAILSRSGGYQGIGFAIPSNMAASVMDSLVKDGKVTRGWLGVAIQDLNPQLAEALGVKVKSGVLISDVMPDSPAERAGMEPSDIVVALDGKAVDSGAKLRNAIAMLGAGRSTQVEVIRSGKRLTLTVELSERESAQAGTTRVPEGQGALGGIAVANLDAASRQRFEIDERVKSGVVVTDLEQGSSAANSGLRPGDVIVELDRRPVTNARDFQQRYSASKGKVLLRVQRGGSGLFILIR